MGVGQSALNAITGSIAGGVKTVFKLSLDSQMADKARGMVKQKRSAITKNREMAKINRVGGNK